MKRYLFICLCSLLPFLGNAQLNCSDAGSGLFSKMSVDLYSAMAVPLGDFSKTDMDGGSYAKPGFAAGLNVNYMIRSNWGIRLNASATFNSVDVVSLAQDELAQDEFMEDISIRSDLYKIINVSALALYKRKISSKFNMMASIGAGMLYMETPHQLHRARHVLVGNNYFEITSAGDYTVIFHAGVEAEYKLKPSWTLIGGTKYSFANAEFEFYRAGQENRIDKRKISLLEFFFGIRLYL